jgi:signal transduction histidine kinase
MLHHFLENNRDALIDRCRIKVLQRVSPVPVDHVLGFGIPMFLDQLIKTLRVEQTEVPMDSRKVSGPSGGSFAGSSEIGEGAMRHGRELMAHGFTVDQVVHDYGDLCQAITDLAFEKSATIEIDEFRTLNRCLDNAIAVAVAEYTYQQNSSFSDRNATVLNERLGFFAHELRNHLNTATLALSAIKTGNVGIGGATGAVLDRSLVALRNLIDRSLAEVRMTAGIPSKLTTFSLADFIREIKNSAMLEAEVRRCTLAVPAVDEELAIDVDHDLLTSALGNLLQNAFKFTDKGSEVVLRAYAAGDRVLIEVEDHCGGLPEGLAEHIFRPFQQGADDRTGLGLGLSIAQRGIEACDGMLRVRDIPDQGCVFTIDLPRHAMPPGAAIRERAPGPA